MVAAVHRPRWQPIAAFLIVALLLIVAYWPTMLRQPAGSDDPLLEDAGEFQVALNVWGTVHGTGYPLYTIAGNSFVHVARLLGVDPAVAPSLFSLVCGLVALAIGYVTLLRLTDRITIAAVTTLLFGLTRATWAYNVFPKTYSFSLLFYFGLFAIAVWPPPVELSKAGHAINVRRRLWWLALVGGLAIAHHRLLGFIMPGLLIALAPDLWHGFKPHPPTPSPPATRWRPDRTFGKSLAAGGEGFRVRFFTFALCIPLVAIGFIPYLYLPLRALAHGVWVYGDPSTPIGFWREFTAVEANYLFTMPPNFAMWLSAARDTLAIFPAQVTPIGLLIILILAARGIRGCYEARIAVLAALPLLIFVLIWPRAVVAQAVIQPIIGFLSIAAALGLAELIKQIQRQRIQQIIMQRLIPVIGAIGVAGLFLWSFADLSAISSTTIGVQEIAIAARVMALDKAQHAKNPIFILPWGMRYSAVAFSHYVTGQTAALAIGDHTIFAHVLNDNTFAVFTDKDSYPLLIQQAQATPYQIESLAADTILIGNSVVTQSLLDTPIVVDGISAINSSLTCQQDAQGNRITLHVTWEAKQKPTKSYSVFVHLIGTDPAKVLATGDESAPEYGWYPTDHWSIDTQIADTYPVDRLTGAQSIQFGLYEQPQPGHFINYPAATLKLSDFPNCG